MKGDVNFLKQLVDSLDEAIIKLEEAVEDEDVKQIGILKKFILEVQGKIKEELE